MSSKDRLIHNTGLDSSDWSRLAHCSAGIWTLLEFTKKWGLSRDPYNYSGIGLGIREESKGNFAPYTLACSSYNLLNCDNFQMTLGISYPDSSFKVQADNQMRTLVTQNLPLVFFVPPKLFGFMRDGLTIQEIRWLMKNDAPETHFVVGAYDWKIGRAHV